MCGVYGLVSAGFLALLALAIYTGMTVNFFSKRYIDWRFSWSYILGWIGIILAFAAGTFHFIACFFTKYVNMWGGGGGYIYHHIYKIPFVCFFAN